MLSDYYYLYNNIAITNLLESNIKTRETWIMIIKVMKKPVKSIAIV